MTPYRHMHPVASEEAREDGEFFAVLMAVFFIALLVATILWCEHRHGRMDAIPSRPSCRRCGRLRPW